MSKKEKINYRTEAEPRTMAGDIPVFCAHDELLPLEKIIPNPKNPNNHPLSQIELLASIIKAQGWRSPITISKRSGFVVAGHGRLLAAKENQSEVAPVEYQEFENEAEEYAALVADNRIAELSEMHDETLAEILEEINKDEDVDLALSGFTEKELDSMLQHLADELMRETEEEKKEELAEVPLSQAGDVWTMGSLTLTVGEACEAELFAVDTMIGAYIERTANLSTVCVRDGETSTYMDVIRRWALENGREDVLETQGIPIFKPKKKK